MIYKSKKDESITAKVIEDNEKYGTVLLEYVSGDSVGKTFSITKSTLKRWWSKTEETSFSDSIDFEKVNTPYNPDVKPHYIPKPKSVIEYEAKKEKRYNSDLPTHENMVNTFNAYLSKINKTYIVFKNGCWLERKSGYINLYATEEIWEKLTEKGMTSRVNGMKNTKLKFVFKITTIEDYNTVSEVLKHE